MNVAEMVADAWEAAIEDDRRRERDRVTELHRWERARNGVWVDRGWLKCSSRSGRWLFAQLSESA